MTALKDGHRATVRGRVRRAAELFSTEAGTECVYRDHRRGLDGAPTDREATPFWVEDPTGKVLVRPEHLVVDTRAERRELVIEAANADIHLVSQRIKELKDQLRSGHARPEVARERRRLAKVATLLCAVKAHARGKSHLGGKLEHQAEWIERNQSLLQDGEGEALDLLAERWEVVIAPGMEVEVQATFRVEPMPAGLGQAGYRDHPTCMCASGSERDPVRVVGIGAAAPRPPDPPPRAEIEAEADTCRPPRRKYSPVEWAALVFAIGCVLWLSLR